MASQKSRPRIQLVLDFDCTITKEDTTSIIGGQCLAKARELASTRLSPDQLPSNMSYYGELYFQQYKDWKDSVPSIPRERKTLHDELSYLSQSRQVELDSFMRVRDAVLGVPGDIGKLECDEALRSTSMMEMGCRAVRSGDVKIRDPKALKSLIAKASDGGNKWGIVSVSWSRRFILGCLLEGGLINNGDVDDIAKDIRANELLAPLPVTVKDGPDVLCSAIDKRDALRQLLTGWNADGEAEHDATGTIYVGDSSTDMGCLAHASIGLYLCEVDNPMDHVLQTFSRLGFDTAPLRGLHEIMVAQNKDKQRPAIYFIKGFEELDEWLSSQLETHRE